MLFSEGLAPQIKHLLRSAAAVVEKGVQAPLRKGPGVPAKRRPPVWAETHKEGYWEETGVDPGGARGQVERRTYSASWKPVSKTTEGEGDSSTGTYAEVTLCQRPKYFLVTPLFQNSLKQGDFIKGESAGEGSQVSIPQILCYISFCLPPVSPAKPPLCLASWAQYWLSSLKNNKNSFKTLHWIQSETSKWLKV